MQKHRASLSREIALDVLTAVSQGSFAEHALSHKLNQAKLRPDDRALATQLVYGVLRWRMRLDSVIGRCLDQPAKKLPPLSRTILRLGLYQLLLLDRIPAHAAVDEAVAQAAARYGPRGAGFVNAVLRNALRNRDSFDAPPRDDPMSLSVYFSQPQWLVERWLADLGVEGTCRWLMFNNTESPLTIRVNTLKAGAKAVLDLFEREGIRVSPVPDQPDALVVHSHSRPVESLPGFKDGLFTVQDRASQMVAPLLRPLAGERILDACSAPGGKTAHLAALAKNDLQIIATDTHSKRLAGTRENLRRLGVSCADLKQGDAGDARFVRTLGSFDKVLVDAPCSNLGVLRHNPEVRYRVVEEDLARFAADQLRILNSVKAALSPGGTLLYAVCAVTREETSGVSNEFLEANGDFSVDPISSDEVCSSDFVRADGFFRTFPPSPSDGVDGFFAARLKRS